MGTKFWWNSLKHFGMLVSWTCLHLILAVNQLCSILRETCSCVCIKITQTAVTVHPSTCRSLNSPAEWGGEQERQRLTWMAWVAFLGTPLSIEETTGGEGAGSRGVWVCVHKSQLYHTALRCGGLEGWSSLECHDFGKAVPRERDSGSLACSRECWSRSSVNVKLSCVFYFYVFLQLMFLMIFRCVFPVRCLPRFISFWRRRIEF